MDLEFTNYFSLRGSIHCEFTKIFNFVLDEQLDGQRLRPCHVGTVVLRNLTANHEHNFLLNVTTRNGEKNSSAYSWFIGK